MLAFVLVSGSLWIILGTFLQHFVSVCVVPFYLLWILHLWAVAGSDAPVSDGLKRSVHHQLPAFFAYPRLWFLCSFAQSCVES